MNKELIIHCQPTVGNVPPQEKFPLHMTIIEPEAGKKVYEKKGIVPFIDLPVPKVRGMLIGGNIRRIVIKSDWDERNHDMGNWVVVEDNGKNR